MLDLEISVFIHSDYDRVGFLDRHASLEELLRHGLYGLSGLLLTLFLPHKLLLFLRELFGFLDKSTHQWPRDLEQLGDLVLMHVLFGVQAHDLGADC